MLKQIPLWILLILQPIFLATYIGYMGWWYGRYIRKTPAQQRSYIPLVYRIIALTFITIVIRNFVFDLITIKLQKAGFDNIQIDLIDWSLLILNPLLGYMIILLTMRYIRR